MGYGLLGLLPEQLFSLTVVEFWDMVDAKMLIQYANEDREMERLAWQTSQLMSATGNFGRKGIKPDKLYQRQFDDLGNIVQRAEGQEVFTSIDKEVKDQKLNELMAKFNK
ncbi:hypothetical protein ABEY65_28270 [Priestia aryabhattai]|uniref:hypothetical protein n=1 Tax=Priestia aryabhattai TaxID=412384 RepID=UPI003D28B2E3